MNTPEAFQLLTLASARDGRTVDKEVAVVWAKDLWDIPLEDAVEAAHTHYRRSNSWLMPADIIAGVRVIRNERDRAERVMRQIEDAHRPRPTLEPRPDNYWEIVRENTRTEGT